MKMRKSCVTWNEQVVSNDLIKMKELWFFWNGRVVSQLIVFWNCDWCHSAVAAADAAAAAATEENDVRTKERLASSPLVTSEQSVELSSSYHNIISLKVPIAEAESESESESDSDHQEDEDISVEEKNFQVSFFSDWPKSDFRLWS